MNCFGKIPSVPAGTQPTGQESLSLRGGLFAAVTHDKPQFPLHLDSQWRQLLVPSCGALAKDSLHARCPSMSGLASGSLTADLMSRLQD